MHLFISPTQSMGLKIDILIVRAVRDITIGVRKFIT